MRNIAREFDDGVMGDPEAVFCGWCGAGRIRVRGHSFCTKCDSGQVGGVSTAATWDPEEKA